MTKGEQQPKRSPNAPKPGAARRIGGGSGGELSDGQLDDVAGGAHEETAKKSQEQNNK